jgi:V/A-type H+/Na+-transporting ATPase subunit E
MGYRELIDSLRQDGEDKVRAIRDSAAAEANLIRREAAARLEALRLSYRDRQAAAVATELQALLATARQQAALIRLEAEQLMADRLHAMASQSLARLRTDGYTEVFAALVAELPSAPWETARVNPADQELARAALPTARIEPDDGITGGLVVTAASGRVQVDNTLEKRLERGWPTLLTRLMAALATEE